MALLQSVPDSLYLIGTTGAASGLILVSGHVQCFKLALCAVFSRKLFIRSIKCNAVFSVMRRYRTRVCLSNDLADVTLVSEDTYRRLC